LYIEFTFAKLPHYTCMGQVEKFQKPENGNFKPIRYII